MWEKGLQGTHSLIVACVPWVWGAWGLAWDIISIELRWKERKLHWEKTILISTLGCGWACVYSGLGVGPAGGSWHEAICKSWVKKRVVRSSDWISNQGRTKNLLKFLTKATVGVVTHTPYNKATLKGNDDKKLVLSISWSKSHLKSFKVIWLFLHPAPSFPMPEASATTRPYLFYASLPSDVKLLTTEACVP